MSLLKRIAQALKPIQVRAPKGAMDDAPLFEEHYQGHHIEVLSIAEAGRYDYVVWVDGDPIKASAPLPTDKFTDEEESDMDNEDNVVVGDDPKVLVSEARRYIDRGMRS